MTRLLFREDAYLRLAHGLVVDVTAQGIILDASLFYATSGGQTGDSGLIRWTGGAARIATALKGEGGAIVVVPEAGAAVPGIGVPVEQVLDWDVRYAKMRLHTALHLLSVVLPFPVTGGQVSADKGRLDFDMAAVPENWQDVEAAVNALIAADHPVSEFEISDEELLANRGLVKTMSVQPPMGTGRVRLVQIGSDANRIDLQPCGGTHVRRTGEIGAVKLGRIENKGRQNRRVPLVLAG